MVKCLPTMHEVLGLIPSTKQTINIITSLSPILEVVSTSLFCKHGDKEKVSNCKKQTRGSAIKMVLKGWGCGSVAKQPGFNPRYHKKIYQKSRKWQPSNQAGYASHITTRRNSNKKYQQLDMIVLTTK